MNKLVEIRNQEFMCRERALLIPNVRFFGWRRRKSGSSARLTRLRSTFENATSIWAIPRKPRVRAFSEECGSEECGMRARAWKR